MSMTTREKNRRDARSIRARPLSSEEPNGSVLRVSLDARQVTVLGSRVDLLDADEAVFQMEDWIAARDGICRQILVTGFHGLWEAFRDPSYKQIGDSVAMWVPDGIAPVWVARLKGQRSAVRVPGAELMRAYLAKADLQGYSSFFYGDTSETLANLTAALETNYPGHRIAGTLSPPFGGLSDDEERRHIQTINDSGADVLWVGLGTPKQDRWIFKHRHELRVPVAAGVGAAFRFLTGQVKRAPRIVGRCGLEWAFRLMMEPKKCWRRCLVQGPQFLFHVAMELTGVRRYG